MSETTARDAVQTVRRTAVQSVSMLRAATGLSSRTPEPYPANESSPAATVRAPASLISANTEIKGAIATGDELHVYGKIEGDVRAAAITVCAGAAIKGDLYAETIVIDGAVEGRLEGQHVLLRAGANVKGEIVHGSLGIDTAAIFEGSIKRGAAPAPAFAAE
jgi:cytoskeletal protein CcmA (bactofilin family)